MPSAARADALWPLALVLVLGIVVAWGFWGYSYDDAFITFRYARHLGEGEGLVYNAGERVYGTSAPGYAVLLAILVSLSPAGISAPEWGTVLSVGGLIAVVVVIRHASAAARRRAGPLATLLLGVGLLTAQWNVELLGGEALPVAGLVACALLAQGRDRPVTAGLLVVGAIFLRLDAVLAAAAIGLVEWARRGRFPSRFALITAVGTVLLVLCWDAWFGAVLPVTLAGKQAEMAAAATGHAEGEWQWLRRVLPPASLRVMAVATAWGLGSLLWKRGLRSPLVQATAIWLVLHEAFYQLVGVPFAPWYHAALFCALLGLAVHGAVTLGWTTLDEIRGSGRATDATRTAFARLGAGLLAITFSAPFLLPGVSYTVRRWGEPPDPRYRSYRELGTLLADRIPLEATVAAAEIGVLGYFSERRVLDLVGLVDEEVLRSRECGVLPALVASRRPDYLVDVDLFRGWLLDPTEPPLGRLYAPAEDLTVQGPSDRTITVLGRTSE